MSHYKPYPTYKDSGVEWLGRVPEHWKVSRLRFLAELNPSINKEVLADLDAEVSFLPMEAIGENGSLNLDQTRSVSDVRNGYSYFKNGDVAFAKVTPCFENGKGALFQGLVGDLGFGTTELTVLRPKSGTDARFLNYIVQSSRFRAFGAGAMTGAGGLKRVPDEFTRNFLTVQPEPLEQSLIADHLDNETAQIDDLLIKKTRFVELLREKRQALITHAVTKGFDPNTKMRESGIEWLGKIPEHWTVKRLRLIASVQTGIAKGKDITDKQTVEVPYLRVANVQDGYLNLVDVSTIKIPTEELDRYLLKKGDVLMNEGGDFDKLGRGHVWQGEIDPCIHQNHVFAVRPNQIQPRWLNAFTSSKAAQFYFMGRSKQSTNLASISSSNLMELPVPAPPDAEQLEILAALSEMSSRLDTLITKTELSLAVLKERRSALITAAVTGQIDLREAS
ncbi:restriction endonuclease subunit S [Pseudomonas sp. TH31]|uniref:restriction endonuclease subunit S n=1 Tax=Pseudomonas sp. TH31 TaxID=2796396 RepID=UPI0019116EF0|nr:restriction endonuclease subunit S [Pseudomonas sp. TH31]MBK5415018.1 restriction endonuclease subunit S [Pseudomonas sp. TH31]